MTAILTCGVEFIVVIAYYHLSVIQSIESGLWGNLTMWSVFILLWSGQIFGQAFRSTGLIPVLLDSFGSLSPESDRQGRALTMVTLLSSFVGTFNLYAVYPVAIPALSELGFDGVQAAAGYLIYASWCIPFAALFIGAVIASTATNLPVSEIARASGMITIPLVFVSIYGTYRILRLHFWERGAQTLFWIVSLSNITGIVLFTQLWPQFHELTLMAGGLIALPLLTWYGRSQKRRLSHIGTASGVMTASSSSAANASSSSYVAPPVRLYTCAMQIKSYVPLLLAIAYASLTHLPAVVASLSRFEFKVAAWGFAPVNINLLTTPAVPLLVAIASCYLVRLKKASPLTDFVRGTRHGASSLSTLLFGSATVYLMVSTGQIVFLGQMLAGGGKTLYEVLDAALVFFGGMTFGQGAPAIFLFSRMQIASAVKLGLPITLLVGLVNLVAMGPTNAVKPALIRFAASLVDIKGSDRDIFRIGLYWGFVQIVVTTITFMIVGSSRVDLQACKLEYSIVSPK